jgi:phage terminase small subunit
MARLTEMQERFCREWLIDFHITYAAIRAGCSGRSASSTGSEWLKMPKIQARIAELRAAASVKTGVSLERTLEQLGKMAYVDPAEMYNEAGELKPISEMPAHVRAAIVGIEQEEIDVAGQTIGRVKKIKLAPREKAVDMIMKHLGGYAEDNKQKAPVFEIIVDIVDDDDKPAPETADPDDDGDDEI